MSSEVEARIRRAIAVEGPLPFSRFMAEALYGDDGYYLRHPVGPDRGFVTSPHIHPVFGDLLWFALEDLGEVLGRPRPLRVVELGAGNGTLAAQVIAGAAADGTTTLDYTGVDISAGARAELAARGLAAASRLDDLPPGDPACVLANELLDNLPVRWLRGTAHGTVEVRVDVADTGFAGVERPCDADLAALAPELEEGEDAFVSPDTRELIASIGRWLRRGFVLLIDYGWEDRPASEVHGYRDHREVAEVLADPGDADITAAVDFGAVRRWARDAGLQVLGETLQTDALRGLGLGRWEDEQRRRQSEAEAGGASIDALRIWQGRGLASMLTDPTGLGGFRWLLLGTPGLTAPAWMTTETRGT